MGVQGFPTVVVDSEERYYGLTIGYTTAETVLERLQMVLKGEVE